jgi:low affinity Fe/Cu permease
MTTNALNHMMTKLGVLSAHPGAFALFGLYAALWITFDRESVDWHAIATMSALFMTLLIQRATHRDTQALHAKLDELLHIHGEAQNALTRIDEREPEDIERFRLKARERD